MIVKDQDGNIVKGLLRNSSGGLVVNDEIEFNKYKREKESVNRVKHLEEELDQLKQLVQTLIRERNG